MLMIFRGVQYQSVDTHPVVKLVESNVLGRYRGAALVFNRVEPTPMTAQASGLKYRGAAA
jgi:hypothetical protein